MFQQTLGRKFALCALLLAAAWFAAPAAAQNGANTEPDAAQPAAAFGVRLGVGGGFGHRDVVVPTRAGDRLLDSAVFPALGVTLDGGGGIGARGLFGIRLQYQTSIALHATEEPAAGSGTRTSLRAHHLALGITPGLRFSGASGAGALRLFVGWDFRGLRAVTQIAIPQYMLHGPILRPELRVPFSDGAAEVRLAPEVQLVSGVSPDLLQLSSTAAFGFAWGGEIELSVRLTRALRLYLDFRESHARVGSAWGRPLTDTERFATAGVDLCY
jgi:hypothetical protein